MVLAQMIAEEIRKALLAVLTDLWTAAWQAGAGHHGGAPDGALEAFLATHGENWVSLISGTGISALLQAIREALAAGDPQRVTALLRDVLKVDERSEQIAVSEVTRAWNDGALTSMKAAGVAYKTWQTRRDGRVCGTCKANQDQGPIPLDATFQSGNKAPGAHPNCRCWLAPWTPPPPATGKVMRRSVGLNGQETWQDYDEPDNAAGGGGRVFQPRRDVQDVPLGGVPGSSAGGSRRGGTVPSPEPVVERAPDADDSAAYGAAEGIGARPGTYWPAPYMDGWWPSPHGHGTGQAPASSPGGANGRPPNGVGKAAANAAAEFLKGAPKAKATAVYRQLLGNYPPESVAWVKGIRWAGPVEVPLELVDFSSEDKWAAYHQKDRVAHFAAELKAKRPVDPVVAIIRPGHNHIRVIDGHHRTLGCKKLGWPVRAYVGYLTGDPKAAYETHLHQVHQGDDPANKSFTAGNLGRRLGARPDAVQPPAAKV